MNAAKWITASMRSWRNKAMSFWVSRVSIRWRVPGGVTISFSSHDVRQVNGGKLQRLGLQPAVSISPTIKGIRDGRDEVLDKALEYLGKPQ